MTEEAAFVALAARLAELPIPDRLGDPVVRRAIRDVAEVVDQARRAPELDGGADPMPLGDVNAFATLLHEVTTGAPPPDPRLAALGGHPDRLPPPLALSAPHAPTAVEAVLARGLAAAAGDRSPTAGELAVAFLEATEGPASGPPTTPARRPLLSTGWRWVAVQWRWVGRKHLGQPLAAVLFALLLLSATVAGGRLGMTTGSTPPVRAALGDTVSVETLRLAVLAVEERSTAPSQVQVGPGNVYVAVDVRCQDVGSDPVRLSPYDWVLTDATGTMYGSVGAAADGPMPEGRVAPGQTVRGVVGFVVPENAKGLVLHFDPELGDGSVEVPLP